MTKHKELWSKFVFILLAIVLVGSMVVMAACGDNNNDNTPTKTTPAKTTPPLTTPAKTTPAATTPTATAPIGALTTNSKLSDLADNPEAKKILTACGFDFDKTPAAAYVMTIAAMHNAAPTQLTAEMVACMDEGLKALAAEEKPTPTAETPAGTGHKGDLTIDSKIDLLVANPDVNALLRHCLGDEMMDNPALPIMAPLYTLSEVIPLTPDLTPEKIQCIKDGLAAMPE